MTVKEILEEYSYHLPSSDSQLKEFTKEIQKAILDEINKNMEGVVIDGVLEGALPKKKFLKFRTKMEEELS